MYVRIKEIHMWLKAYPVRKLIIAMLIIFASVHVWGKVMDGIKVIDPGDPRFNPEKFRFEDYAQSGELYELLSAALLIMFPPGTEKEYIEHILVKNAGASARLNASGNYTYSLMTHGGLSGWIINIQYDDENRAIAMYRRGTPLYVFKN